MPAAKVLWRNFQEAKCTELNLPRIQHGKVRREGSELCFLGFKIKYLGRDGRRRQSFKQEKTGLAQWIESWPAERPWVPFQSRPHRLIAGLIPVWEATN